MTETSHTSSKISCVSLITSDESITTFGIGTANTGVTAVEKGTGTWHKTVLSFTDLALPNVADNAAKGVGKLLYTLPAGAHIIDSAYMSVALTAGEDTTATPDVGLGSVIATGTVSVLSGTATFEDIMTGQTASDCAGTATVGLVQTTLVRKAADAKTVHLNVAATWADTAGTDLSLKATGTVTIFWKTVA